MALLLALALLSPQSTPVIHIDPTAVLRRFDPQTAFGAGIDGHETGEVESMLSRPNAELMKSIGLRSLTYRLRTELGCEVWHWNPEGTWSDPSNKQGYWTSSTTSRKPINLTYGYRLPRRGDSIDQANRDDYSRLDDGDTSTFWKSNPYLDPKYTGVPYAKSPQWVVIDFRRPREFNEVRIDWAEPYATKFRVEYAADRDAEGPWGVAKPLLPAGPRGLLRFRPFRARYLKLVLLASSEAAPAESSDARDGLGFAIREIEAGATDAKGVFHDEIRHAPRNELQTRMYVSSTDPWHRESDRDRRVEQPGFDLILRRGFGEGQSILLPAGCLYDTPENVANEAQWLKRRGVKIRGIELGEEPDGNWVDGDHFAMLYMQMAGAIRKALTTVPIGGPSFQTVVEDFVDWPHVGKPWLTQFIETLRNASRSGDFNFCTFEWYPFDNVRADPAVKLPKALTLLHNSLRRLRRLGMEGMPWYISEYGYSSFGGPEEVTPPGAVFNFDFALAALAEGCETSYLYGYEPNELIQEVRGVWGNNMVLLQRGDDVIKMPTYWGAWLLTHRLCSDRGPHELLRVSGGDETLGVFGVRRPDGSLALALTNRSPVARRVSVDAIGPELKGWSYGEPQFAWSPVSDRTLPTRNLPPAEVTFKPSAAELPPYSITILRMG